MTVDVDYFTLNHIYLRQQICSDKCMAAYRVSLRIGIVRATELAPGARVAYKA
jgi:hypothetical protein